MKWIGQHIWDFISRFRSDVYLENITDHGSDPDRFLTMDSTTGKVSYRTGSEVLSDIGASSEATDLEFSGNTANGVLTYGGAAQIDVESTLTYSSDTINIGVADDSNSYIKRLPGSSSDGGDLYVTAGYAHGSDNSGGNLWLSAGSSTGSANGGSIKFISTVAGSGGGGTNPNTPALAATLSNVGDLTLTGDLTISGGNITNAITFDNGLTGALNGNASGSSGSCTGNAATATLATNAQGIAGATDGDVTITSDGHVVVKLDSDDDESNQRFKITDNSDAVVFHVQEDGNVALAGNIITNSGSNNDLTLESDGSMGFTIDRDNDETSQNWSFVNYNATVAEISESGSLTLGDTNGTSVSITTPAHDNGNGSNLNLAAGFATAGQTDKSGGTLALYAGQSTGTGGNEIRFYTYPAAGSTGTSLNSAVKAVTITNDGNLRVDGNVITNNTTAANFSVLSSRILELQHAGSYDIQLGNSTNPDVLKVEGDAQEVTINGTLELGHATDTTIARSAAGTVTIEGKTIATTNKTIAFFNSSFFNSGTGSFYAPFNYIFEQTSLSTGSYFGMISAPYDGRVLKVSSRTQSGTSKTTTVEMYLNGDDSDLTNDQVGTDLVISSYTFGGTGACASDWVFSAGDALSFRITNSASASGQTLTFVIEFDLDT